MAVLQAVLVPTKKFRWCTGSGLSGGSAGGSMGFNGSHGVGCGSSDCLRGELSFQNARVSELMREARRDE